jgi:hypothetical protein
LAQFLSLFLKDSPRSGQFNSKTPFMNKLIPTRWLPITPLRKKRSPVASLTLTGRAAIGSQFHDWQRRMARLLRVEVSPRRRQAGHGNGKSQTKINTKHMKQLVTSFNSHPLVRRLGLCLAAIATVGVLAFAGSSLLTPGNALAGPGPSAPKHENPQVAEIDQLLADFHGALSYGGDITAMMNLWADNSSITLNGTAHIGKAAVQTFFTTGGYFLNNWVSLAPEYKTEITIHGDIAEATTQCVAIDLNSTPMVVRSVTQVNATMVREGGKWLFISMNNTAPAPL